MDGNVGHVEVIIHDSLSGLCYRVVKKAFYAVIFIRFTKLNDRRSISLTHENIKTKVFFKLFNKFWKHELIFGIIIINWKYF